MDNNEQIRILLNQLGDYVRDAIVRQRGEKLSGVSRVALSDVIYEVDALTEEWILHWLGEHWPPTLPVELLMEGLDELATFPVGTPIEKTEWKLMIDPVDGTRGLMFDKRPAWFMAAVAPQRFENNRLSDILVSSMTELPLTKQWRADQLSAIRGRGAQAEMVDVRSGERNPLPIQLSEAADFRHGFAGLAKFFPAGRVLVSEIEDRLWKRLYPEELAPAIFDDQFISCGGQFYEILMGKDRMLGDLRPLTHQKLFGHVLQAAHPYDICTALILEEAGGVFEHPLGGPVAAPMDTTSSVVWIAYANVALAEQVRKVLPEIIREVLQ